jgi:hypothetical protein
MKVIKFLGDFFFSFFRTNFKFIIQLLAFYTQNCIFFINYIIKNYFFLIILLNTNTDIIKYRVLIT